MAIVQLGAIAADIRGSVSGNTWSRNLGGAFVRKRIVPVNPDTARQIAVRQRLSYLAVFWSGTLDQAQRDTWDTYAESTVWTNRLGLTITITGLAAFIRTNTLLDQGDVAVQLVAPTSAGHASAVSATFAAYHDTDKLALDEPSAGWNKDVDNDVLLVFQGLPLSLGSLRIPHRFRFVKAVIGNATTPETFPLEIDPGWMLEDLQRITLGFVHVDPLGRVSFRTHAQVVTSPSS